MNRLKLNFSFNKDYACVLWECGPPIVSIHPLLAIRCNGQPQGLAMQNNNIIFAMGKHHGYRLRFH